MKYYNNFLFKKKLKYEMLFFFLRYELRIFI